MAFSSFFSRERKKTKTKCQNTSITFHVVNFLAKYGNIYKKDKIIKFARKILMSALASMCNDNTSILFKRPGVAGAVLSTVSNSSIQSAFSSKSS